MNERTRRHERIRRLVRNMAGNGDLFRDGDVVCVADSKRADWYRVRREPKQEAAHEHDDE
jgi:uncharacterized protein YdaT